MPAKRTSFVANSFSLLKQTFSEWIEDKAPQLGAALAYYTVFFAAAKVFRARLYSRRLQTARPPHSRHRQRRQRNHSVHFPKDRPAHPLHAKSLPAEQRHAGHGDRPFARAVRG